MVCSLEQPYYHHPVPVLHQNDYNDSRGLGSSGLVPPVPLRQTVVRAQEELPAPHTTDSVRLAWEDPTATCTFVVPPFAVTAQAIVDTVTHLHQGSRSHSSALCV